MEEEGKVAEVEETVDSGASEDLGREAGVGVVKNWQMEYNRIVFRRRDVPNGEIPKANLLFLMPICACGN